MQTGKPFRSQTRRRLLSAATAVAVTAALGVSSCDESPPPFLPEGGIKVWIAEEITGRTANVTGSTNLSDVQVDFWAGFDDRDYVLLGRTTSGFDGRYAMTGAEFNGDAGFWRFFLHDGVIPDGNGDVTIFLKLTALKPNFEFTTVKWTVKRRPQETAPGPSEALRIRRNVLMRGGGTIRVNR